MSFEGVRDVLVNGWRWIVAVVVVVVATAVALRLYGDHLRDHVPEVVELGIAVVGLAFVLLSARFIVKHHWALLGTIAFGAVAGVFVLGGVAFLDPAVLPFIEQRERVAARSLVGVVGNGSIAFVRRRGDNLDIYVIDPEGTDTPTQLTRASAEDTDPAWSPNGERIAFTSTRDGDAEIYVMKADGTDQEALTENDVPDGQPAWSPDGERVAFVSTRDGDADIYVMQADGSGEAPLTQNDVADSEPAWSPDGERLAFTRSLGGDADVWVMNVEGSGQTNLTLKSDGPDGEPAWGPDGAYLAFTSYRGRKTYSVYRYYEHKGESPTQAVTTAAASHWPAWAPDGGQLAFLRNESAGRWRLYIETDPKRRGEQSRRVFDLPVEEARLSWQPLPRLGLDLPEDENDVIARYAPIVYLHPGEAFFPMQASTFVGRSELRCGAKNLGDFEAKDLGESPLVTEKDRRVDDEDPRSRCTDRNLNLALEQGLRHGTRSRSKFAGLYTGIPVYAERKSNRAITYWFFYAYSKTAGLEPGAHQGDWERITICLGPGGRPRSVFYYQHRGAEPREWAWTPKFGTHPLVYSAKGSHASYPDNIIRETSTQDRTDEGLIWPTWQTLRTVGDEDWYGFRGRWGRDESSPADPAVQGRRRPPCG